MRRAALVGLALAVAIGLAARSLDLDADSDFDWGALPPWPAFRVVNAVMRAAPLLWARFVPPPLLLLEVAGGTFFSKALYTASVLGVADELKRRGPTPAAELAAAVGAKPGELHRVLRALSTRGIFRQTPDGRWANNRASGLLRADHPATAKPAVEHWGDESVRAHAHMAAAVKTGFPHAHAFAAAHNGDHYWQWLDRKENAAANARFNQAMLTTSSISNAAIVADGAAAFPAGATVVDVGGGIGGFLAALLRARPDLTGVLFDRPLVIDEARGHWAKNHAALAPRVTHKAGSFFNAGDLPAGDVFFMRFIIHDHNDTGAAAILKAVRAVAKPDSSVVIADIVMPPAGPPGILKALIDTQMMVMLDAQERTAAEFGALLDASGWQLDRIIEVRALTSLVVARPK